MPPILTPTPVGGGGGGAGVTDGDKGDVTVGSSGSDWQLDPGVVGRPELADNGVTLAKLADIATARLLGRTTAGTGDPEALTVAQALALLSVYTQAQTDTAISTAINNLINGAPGALDTLDELAAAFGDDANFVTTVTNALALKAPLASPTFTGDVVVPDANAATEAMNRQTSDARYGQLSGAVFTGEVSALDLLVQGITGATSDTRLVGGNASGPPTSGTFAALDIASDLTGQLWICTIAGSPGTWVPAGAGREAAYAEITSNPSAITAVGVANRVDVASALTIDITVGARPMYVQLYAGSATSDTADRGGGLAIVEGTIGGGAGTARAQATGHSATANLGFNLNLFRRFAAGTGAITLKAMGWAITGGSFQITAATGQPVFLRAWEA